jgi:hypothetical protein
LPCTIEGGRLVLDDMPLDEVVEALEGAAWLVSKEALVAAVCGEPEVRALEIGRLPMIDVFGVFTLAGWWAVCYSSRELERAVRGGFPPERIVVTGHIKDDGLVKDALLRGVAVLEVSGEDEAANVARIAAHLQRDVPRAEGAPPSIGPGELPAVGGLLTRVLRHEPTLAVDAPWSVNQVVAAHLEPPVYDLWPLCPGETVSCLFEGLSSHAAAPPVEARLHGTATRGSWIFIPSCRVLDRPLPDPAWAEPETIAMEAGRWAYLTGGSEPAKGS